MPQYRSVTLFLLITVLPIIAFVADVSHAEDREHTASVFSGIAIEGAFNIPRRADFRDFYGKAFSASLAHEHAEGERFRFGLKANVWWDDPSRRNVDFLSISLTPYWLYTFHRKGKMHPVLGAGIGVTYRRISEQVDLFPSRAVEWHVEEFGPQLLVLTGVDFAISDTFMSGLRLYFDHHFWSDGDRGHFGDTGGFHLSLRLGIRY